MIDVRSWTRAAFIAAAVAFIAPLPASAEAHVLTFANGSDLTGLNPLQPEGLSNTRLNFLTMAYLTRFGKHGLAPELLSSLPTERNGGISADGETVRLKLKPGLRWSDGAPLTSADIAFTVQTINAPKTNSIFRAGFDKISHVDTPNDVTAILHLTEPYGLALQTYFSSRSAPILPKHRLSGIDVNTAAYNALPIGAGPFRFTKWLRGDRVELERNPYYALGTPKLERIVYKMIPTPSGTAIAIRTGAVDVAFDLSYTDYRPLEHDPAIHVLTERGVLPIGLTFNVQHSVLADLNVRRALRLATDRNGILQRAFFGSGVLAESPVATADPYVARIPLVPYDPAGAAALLDRAGWKRGPDGMRVKNGQRFVLEVVARAGAGWADQILELVRANWTAVGVAVTTRRYAPSLMFAPIEQGGILFGGKFDVILFSPGEQTAADAAERLCNRIPPQGTNVSRLCVPSYDALVAKAGATSDPAVAGPMYREAQVRSANLVTTIVLALRNALYLSRDGVVGAALYPFSFFYDPMALDVVK